MWDLFSLEAERRETSRGGAWRDDSLLAGQPSRILHGLLNVSQLEFGVSCDDLGESLSVGQKREDEVNRDAQAANAGLAIALLGVYGNSIKHYCPHRQTIIPWNQKLSQAIHPHCAQCILLALRPRVPDDSATASYAWQIRGRGRFFHRLSRVAVRFPPSEPHGPRWAGHSQRRTELRRCSGSLPSHQSKNYAGVGNLASVGMPRLDIPGLGQTG